MKLLTSLFQAINSLASYLESKALSQALKDVIYCEEQQIKIHEEITEFTQRSDFDSAIPGYISYLGALNRRLHQWEQRTATFDERL